MAEQYKSREERKRALAAKQPKQNQGSKKTKKPRSLWKKIFLTFLALGIIGIVTGGVTFAVIAASAPPLDEKKLKDSFSSKLYDVNTNEVTEFGEIKRQYVPYKDIPKTLEKAVLATEDARFYEHKGVDFIRLGGAVIANVKEGFGAEGASTITQQVIKNSLLSSDKTMTRKVKEAWLSFQLEQKYSKQEILEMYLNKIYFAGNIYGVQKASEIFYGKKDLHDLELHEAAMIAGMPQSPNNYDPRKHPENAEKRRNIVLNLMAQHGFITQAEADAAKAVPVDSTLVPLKEKANPYHAFVEEVIEEVKEKTGLDAGTAGLKIYTTLDPDAQENVEEVLNGDIINYQNDNMQAGVALIDTQSGEIRAIGGGRNQPIGGYNYATDVRRQPGSSIKPVLDYAPAIEYLQWSTAEMIDDEPYTYSNGTPIRNFDRNHLGPMTIRTALAKSRNIPALKAFQAAKEKVGEEKMKDFAKGLGIPLNHIYESYSIGGFGEDDKGVSPMQMAGAFSTFGNNGVHIEPHTVKKIVLSDGTEVSLEPEAKPAMSDYTAFMITDMMKSVVKSGTGTAAAVPNLNIAGKTGTSNFSDIEKQKNNIPAGAAKDSWFVGYNPNYTAAVWTGYPVNEETKKDRIYLTKTEQNYSKRIFKEVLKRVAKGDDSDWEKPKSVEMKRIEKGTGQLASSYTPKDQVSIEYFVKGTGPKVVSKKYTKADKPSGLQVSYNESSNSISLSWNYKDGGASFQVSQSVDGGSYSTVQNSGSMSYTVSGVTPGATYRFQVVAMVNGKSSNAAATAITVPGAVTEEEPEEEIIEEEPDTTDEGKVEEDSGNEEDNQNEDQTGIPNNGNPNNGNPNGQPNSGNGSQNGNGNGNQGGNNGGNGSNGNTGNNGNGNGSGNGNQGGGKKPEDATPLEPVVPVPEDTGGAPVQQHEGQKPEQ
ncbi:PBP1A family penicillin-binding protein [Metabacillus fastidiosus]|uniref:PBP1A family penicillin-binding protein n=1 Tax=Metabacillus fastidiosus TaxID=1458 RepID=UPI000825427C|nr:PBP1A family penicillin-binding protein [Metabacillus fastidiosus]MED4462840.1 PBP1A family penicillin-binding protein [Metabacillus fastidiosus]